MHMLIDLFNAHFRNFNSSRSKPQTKFVLDVYVCLNQANIGSRFCNTSSSAWSHFFGMLYVIGKLGNLIIFSLFHAKIIKYLIRIIDVSYDNLNNFLRMSVRNQN